MMEESPMKKQQYIAAVACLVAGAIGFASVYATEKNQEKRHRFSAYCRAQRVCKTHASDGIFGSGIAA